MVLFDDLAAFWMGHDDNVNALVGLEHSPVDHHHATSFLFTQEVASEIHTTPAEASLSSFFGASEDHHQHAPGLGHRTAFAEAKSTFKEDTPKLEKMMSATIAIAYISCIPPTIVACYHLYSQSQLRAACIREAFPTGLPVAVADQKQKGNYKGKGGKPPKRSSSSNSNSKGSNAKQWTPKSGNSQNN